MADADVRWRRMTSIIGSRDTTRLAFQNAVISHGEGWMEMIQARHVIDR